MTYKIESFETICKRIETFKEEGKTVVLCYGLFHFLHIGHIRYLKQAKNHGDILMVSVLSDRYVHTDEDIQFDENLRAEAIASLGFVDAVVINPFERIIEFIEHVRPNIFFVGFESDRKGRADIQHLDKDIALLDKWGVERVVMQEDDFSSTLQINRYFSNLPDDIQKYLRLFKQRYDFENLIRILKAMKDLRVLVIGDMIIDDYHYCTAIGKSSKDPTLALKYESNDVFGGGVLAIANHVAGFSHAVDLITILGEKESYEDFIRLKLNDPITPYFYYKAGAPTLVKRRFLDGYSMNKLLEVYVMDESNLDEELEKEFHEFTRSRLPEYDLVIAADFGHGTINMNLKRLLAENAPFLAVNAQSNAGNRGFNNITKYPSADYISMAEHEIRLEMRDPAGQIRHMMNTLTHQLNCRIISVTRGRKGSMVSDNEDSFVQVPSFSQKVVDRVGAGDAYFAVSSMAAFLDVSCELVGFLGNVAGSLAVQMMGNKKNINRRMLTEQIESFYLGSID